jgi:hypothetical protein
MIRLNNSVETVGSGQSAFAVAMADTIGNCFLLFSPTSQIRFF